MQKEESRKNMISLILSILKLLFTIIVCIIIAILVVILLVLFVPIRYEFSGKKDDTIFLHGRVSWLLRILSFRISYIDNNLNIKFSIFGKVLHRSKKDAKEFYEDEKDIIKKEVTEDTKQIISENKPKKTTTKDLDEKEAWDKKNIPDEKDISKEKSTTHEKSTPGEKNMSHNKITDQEADFENEEKEKFNFFEKIKAIFRKGIENFKKVQNNVTAFRRIFKKIKIFIAENKPGFKVAFRSLKKILNHIKPKKFDGDIEFGTGDPCQTGQILGGISIIYSFYGRNIQLMPNFEERILIGSIFLKGRIRLLTLLIIGLKLYFNHHFRHLLNKFKVLKEEL